MRYVFMRFPEGKGKCVTLSYDDARKSDIRFSDMLQKYGLKCTFNVTGEKFRSPKDNLTADEIKKYIIDRGHEVALHNYNHRASGYLRSIEGIREVLDNRTELEQEFDMIIRGMAYPDSGIHIFSNPDYTYEKIKNYLTELDVAYARNTATDNGFDLPNDWHNWKPTAHHDRENVFELIDQFLKIDLSENMYIASRRSRLFYLWGHSFEFDNKNNWDHGEEVMKKLSGHDDIWYATNIEIYDYVQAYNSLIYSADGTRIYNPTLKTIWLDIDKKVYEIKSGETLKL
ncbi:MAG: polysaccharide deacetylase family protein [Clostridia bacterium]|nr:polysaccharide deacetylase family protein [Clostridia bacterium]